MTTAPRTISLVVPIYCEQESIDEFYRRAKAVLVSLEPRLRHEIVFVNDGSTDGSPAMLRALAERDPYVRVIHLSRNFGHQKAITAGLDHATGDAVVVIDGDLQDPPEVVTEMVRKWEEGFEVVYGVRKVRRGEGIGKSLTAKIFYRLLAQMSDTPLPRDSGDFRLMDKAVVAVLRSIREESRYLRGLVPWIGFAQVPLPYARDPRYAGETKYGPRRMIRFAADAITSFSDRPLRLSMQFGLVVTAVALLMAAWIVIGKLLYPETIVQGWASMIVAVLFLGGAQLVSIGILGEYVARIYRETKDRPLYVVARRHGFGPDE